MKKVTLLLTPLRQKIPSMVESKDHITRCSPWHEGQVGSASVPPSSSRLRCISRAQDWKLLECQRREKGDGHLEKGVKVSQGPEVLLMNILYTLEPTAFFTDVLFEKPF